MKRGMRQKVRAIAVAAVVLCAALCIVALAGCAGQQGSASSEAESFDSAPAEASFEPPEPEAPALPTEPLYVLLLGDDSRAETDAKPDVKWEIGDSRSDVMMLVRIDPVSHRIAIVSIPRDTMMYVDGVRKKINTAWYTGPESSLEQVESLTGVRAEHYMMLRFPTFVYFIDALGGVDVNVPFAMSYNDIMSSTRKVLHAGDQHLDGSETLILARKRTTYATQADASRQIQVRNIVKSAISKVLDDPALLDTAIEAFYTYGETDWDRAELEVLARDFVEHADEVEFVLGSGPYDGYIHDDGEWYAVRDEDTWAEVIRTVEEGGDPTDVVPLPVVAKK